MIKRDKITCHYIILEGTTEIAANTFIGYPDIVSIEIPNSITKIGEGVFYNCYSLTSVNIPMLGSENLDAISL